MMTLRHDFASDNTAGAAPEAMQALIEANAGFSAAYGADDCTARAADAVRALLDADAEVRFVASGTAANALSLAALCRPFEAVLAHRDAHVTTGEASAPVLFGHGLALVGLDGASGRIDPSALAKALAEPEASYRQSPAALSLTQATEYGALYDRAAMEALIGAAKAKGLGVHLDGARLANAAAAGFDIRGLGKAGVDILVLGGTKAGMPLSEALVLFDRALGRRLDTRLKQAGQLPSKGRYLAAPWLGMLESGAWVARAAHANAMARKLAALMPFEIAYPVEANGVFARIDDEAMARLHAESWSIHRAGDGSARFMCSWATSEALVDEMGEALHRAAG